MKKNIVIVLLIALVVVAGALVFRKDLFRNSETQNTADSSVLSDNKYRNEQYGFSLIMPEGWVQGSDDTTAGFIPFTNGQDRFNIFIRPNPNDLSVTAFFDGKNDFEIKDAVGGVTDISVGGKPAKRMHDVIGEITAQVIAIPHGNVLIKLEDTSKNSVIDIVAVSVQFDN